MADQTKDVTVEPLSEDDLDSVSGGVCSWDDCSNGAAELDVAN